jgi:uncharacterized protein (DUF2147 family)
VAALWITAVFVLAAAAVFLILRPPSRSSLTTIPVTEPTAETNRPAAAAPVAPAPNAAARLVGRWVREDGGYVLEIRGAAADGTLQAAYFNPNPINVSRAAWNPAERGFFVFIELRDVNYPGATYKLNYAPDKDELTGEYFQPTLQETFAVRFVRERN